MAESRPIRPTPENHRQIALILQSAALRRRQTLITLFNYLVKETMEGRHGELTQQKIGADVFGIVGSFEEQDGVKVRTAVGRLRTALDLYYKNEAKPNEIRIHMPPRRFQISVEHQETENEPDPSPTDAPDRTPDRSRTQKRISQNELIGQQGINLIERRCLEMGFLWRPSGLDAGIDGFIEIRDGMGQVTNCIIQVQSKATERSFEAETQRTLEFRCAARDLDYWLGGNAPVILIRSRPSTDEAYWVSVKDYFNDPSRRKTGKIVFDKVADQFDFNAKAALQRLATLVGSGFYLPNQPKQELVFSNLLKLARLPERYYMASTDYRTPAELFARLRELRRHVQGEWVLQSRMLTTFHDLSTRPWAEVTYPGTLEVHETEEWAQTDDPVRRRLFVHLLHSCLKELLYQKGVRFSHETNSFYFRASQDLSDIEYAYQSRENKTSRTVFKGYPKKTDHTQMSYYRHSAFEGHFVRYGGVWFLQITPTYHFTRDGNRLSRFAPDLMSGIKRLENNQAVHGQVVMWGHILTARSLFDDGPDFLEFSSLQQFQVDAGLDDDAWLKREDADRSIVSRTSVGDDRQQSFLV